MAVPSNIKTVNIFISYVIMLKIFPLVASGTSLQQIMVNLRVTV